MNCRFCGSKVTLPFIDLINAPPSNSFLTAEQLKEPETYFPLKVLVCESCWLVQVDEHKRFDEIFNSDYAYFSSFSSSWLRHSEAYVQSMIRRLELNEGSLVVEVASNDGYLLQYFVEASIPAVGIEPTHGTACAAREKGVETIEAFWGTETARQLVADRGQCDLMLGNNVLAHVPDINDFAQGFRLALAPGGALTFEFPHLVNLIKFNQFDTIYHEHFSYLTLSTVQEVLAAHGLVVYDVEEWPTHGGSLRVFARHEGNAQLKVRPSVAQLIDREAAAGMRRGDGYQGLQQAADQIRATSLDFLVQQRTAGKQVVAYGAAAKGNTFLNYCGLKGTELVRYVVDRSPHKQGLFMPGSHIPIVAEQRLRETRPDFVIVLPWNIHSEIREQLAYIKAWGGQLVTCIPELCVWEDQ